MTDLNPAQHQVLGLLEAVAAGGAGEREVLNQFMDFARTHGDCCERSLDPGHFTGSAWLVSADGERVLLTHHRKLDRWLQLGGHADGDSDLARVALREAEEESGLSGLAVEPEVFDLDRHAIPARGAEPEHWHYDVRFVVRAGADEAFRASDESHALAWRRIDQLAMDEGADVSMRRMACRWLDRQVAAEALRLATARCELLAMPIAWMQALAEADARFTAETGLPVSAGFLPDEDRPAFDFFVALTRAGRLPARWGSFLLRSNASGEIIGTAGYKGAPREGAVEIGYSVAPAWRGQGIAREAAACLVGRAFEDVRVARVLAHTRAEENASVKVLRSCGFRFAGDVEDPDDGALWKWELAR